MNFDILAGLINEFDIYGKPLSATECKNGNINRTYIIDTDSGNKYILQCVNENVFKSPEQVTENILNITSFLKHKISERGGDPSRETLTLIPSKSGGYGIRSNVHSGYWRVYDFIRDTLSHELIERKGQFYNAGFAFGDFQHMLDRFPAESLYETIPNFHNTPKRYADFKSALERDVCGRSASIAEEIAFIEEHSWLCPLITDGIEKGILPLRVTHNDTKLNNVMMDIETDKAVCVIDLDTVMPGSLLFDYGDAIRYGASNAGEDETELSKVFIRPELFEEFTMGFLSGLGGTLNDAERNALPDSVAVIALELAMRFLADYLDGDKYFITDYSDHNLVRARTQLKLVEDVLEKREQLSSIVFRAIERNS